MADRTTIEEIKQRLDIAEVVRGYVNLKKSGANEFGLCPFHQEKTPSFSVNSGLGIYKCFGCNEAGDVISFLQKIEGLTFPEALKLAAEKAGVRIANNFSMQDSDEYKAQKLVLEVNELAAKFFHYILVNHKVGERAREYLRKRKISKKSVEKFRLGYAPNQWSALKSFLNKHDCKDKFLIESGLLVERNNNVYDKFRGRIIFPLINEKGSIAGFAGRIIDENSKGPKYLNSPETKTFNKSTFLFGFYQGKNQIRTEKSCILVEGPTDVIMSNQIGISNICAPQGTSLTPSQLQLLKRYAQTLLICFDQDEAGQRALKRAIELAGNNFDIKVIDLGEIKDADEYIRKNGKKWQDRISSASRIVDYFLKKSLEKYNVKTIEGKLQIAGELLPIIAALKNKIEKDHYIKELALYLNVAEENLHSQLAGIGERDISKNLREVITKEKDARFSREREDYLFAVLLQTDELPLNIIKKIKKDFLTSDQSKEIYEFIVNYKKRKISSVELMKQESDESLVKKISDLMMINLGKAIEDIDWVKQEIQIVMNLLQRAFLRKQMNKVQIELNLAEKRGDDKLVDKLNAKMSELISQFQKL